MTSAKEETTPSEFKCSNTDHTDRNAVMYCSVCKGNFCEECEKAHSNLLKYHTKYVTRDFLQVSSIPKEPERCPLHPTRPLDLFCPTHYVLCCSKCNLGKGGTHKGCPAVPFDEEDNIKSVYCNLETDISTLTNKIETMLGPIMAAIAKNQDKSQENVVSVKAEVVAAFDRIRDALKTREEALLQEIEKMSEGSSLSWVVTKINDMDEEAKKIIATGKEALELAKKESEEKYGSLWEMVRRACVAKEVLRHATEVETEAVKAVKDTFRIAFEDNKKGEFRSSTPKTKELRYSTPSDMKRLIN